MQTPYFIIKKSELESNINDFRNALMKYWPNSIFSYSVKTNSLPWILEFLKNKEIHAEVVSDNEYEIAEKCGYTKNKVIYNGPIKSEEQFLSAYHGDSIINIDSTNELNIFKKNKLSHKESIGLRINVETEIFDEKDIGYIDEGFRFGFSSKSIVLDKAIDIVTNGDRNKRIGLHFHCNSISRSKQVYESLAKFINSIIKKYNINPSYIDIGGGFFGGIRGKTTADEYINAITQILKETVDINSTKLIIEPGSAIIGSCVDLVSTVRDVKELSLSRIITIDTSRIHLDPLWKKDSYFFSLSNINERSKIAKQQIICGYTCMDHDRIMKLIDYPEIKEGDQIRFHRVGAYTMTFGGPFINFWPSVYIFDNKGYHLVRNIKSVGDYINMQSYKEDK